MQDGANLLTATNANLTAGGFCGVPTRIEPGNPGSVTAPAEHFVVYGTPADFPLPSGWTLKYPGVCDRDSVAACPGTDCYYGHHALLGPCIERASVAFWRGMMDMASSWQKDNIQGGIGPAARLVPWTNGTGATGSTCTTGQPCPTRSMWVPFKGAGTGSDGYGVNWIQGDVFDDDPVIPLSIASGYILRDIGHEYLHTFGAKWGKQASSASGYDAYSKLFGDLLLAESLPTLTGMTMCVPGYPGNPNGDSVPPTKPCVSSHTLYHDTWPGVDKYLEFPGGNQNYLAPYTGFWFYRYAAEQFAIPLLKRLKAHPSGGDSVLPVAYEPATQKPKNLDARRADEGIDLVGFLLRSLDPSQTSDPCAFSSSPPSKYPAKARMDCVLKQKLGRGFDDVLFDFHTMLVLKDYVVDDARWTPEWLGDFNAGATARLWKADPAHNLTAAPLPKGPLRNLRPYVKANGQGYPKNQLELMPDGVHRAYRLMDTYSCADPSCGTINVNRLSPGATVSSPFAQPIGSYRAAFVSISPDPGWVGTELEVWVEKKKGKSRVRVFTVDVNGVAKLHPQCVQGTLGLADECLEGAAYKGKVRVPVKVDATMQEILIVASGGPNPSSFTWQFGPQASELTIISPTNAKPALIGAPAPLGEERAFLLMFTARDAAGKPYDIVSSSNLDILIDGASITANCPDSPQNPAPCPFRLLGMSGGSYMAVVQVPVGSYPSPPLPKALDLEIRLKNGSASQADLEPHALRADTARENLSTMFVIDTSGSMADYGKLEAARKAANLVVDAHLDYSDAAGLVMFAAHAQTLSPLTWLDPTTAARQDLKSAIGALVPAGSTALGDGLFEGQDELASAPFLGNNPVTAMFVLSDGLSMCNWNPHKYYYENVSADGVANPNNPACAPGTVPTAPPWNPQGGAGPFANPTLGFKARLQAGLSTPIITGVGVGPDADMEALGSMAAISGGVAFHVPSVAQVQTLSLDLGDAFRAAFNPVAGYERVATAKVAGLGALPPLVVEPGARELLVSVMTNSPDPNLVELTLLDPQGWPIPAERLAPDSHAVFRVFDPAPGVWSFAPIASSSTRVYVEQAIRSRLRLFSRADVEGGTPIITEPPAGQPFDDGRWAGKPLLIQAAPHEGTAIATAAVYAEVKRPDGTTSTIPLEDDGLHRDGEAGDGLFAALFSSTAQSGTYQIRVVADGTSPSTGAPFHREAPSSVRLWNAPDADGDLLPTWWETLYGTDPDAPDAWADPDQDGLSNEAEFASHARPDTGDTDGGGESDRSEVEHGRDPSDPSDDAVAVPSLTVFPGNEKLIVRNGLVPQRGVSLEVQAAPSDSLMTTLYSGVVPQGDLPLHLPNEVPHCVRARVTFSGVQSAWSPVVCGTPRLDPEAPTLELSLDPRAACVDAETAIVKIDASDGDIELLRTLYGQGRTSLDTDAVVSGVAEMRVAIDSNIDEAPWQPFTTRLAVPLGAAASANLGVRLRDAFGNESELRVLRIERCGCDTDTDCGGPDGGRICEANTCVSGCRGEGGNGCPRGERCSSTTSVPGVCGELPPGNCDGCALPRARRSNLALAALGALALGLTVRRRRRKAARAGE